MWIANGQKYKLPLLMTSSLISQILLTNYRKNIYQTNLFRAFEDYIKTKEREEFQNKKAEKRRRERKNREAFAQMVEDKLKRREITMKTKWKEFVTLY